MTTPILSKYERARLIGARSLQLALGAPPLVEVTGQSAPMRVALSEMEANMLPLVVLR